MHTRNDARKHRDQDKWSVSSWSWAHAGHRHLGWEEISVLPLVRRFLNEKHGVLSKAVQLYSSGTEPRAIWHRLKASYSWINYKNVDTCILKVKHARLDGLTPIEALHAMLAGNKAISDSLRDEDNRVVSLFFSPKALRPLLQRFHRVLLLDCMYKTNKHVMPLLHVVGMMGNQRSFTAECCFMRDETTESYVWALSKLSRALPPPPSVAVVDHENALISAVEALWKQCRVIICRWHVSKNISTNYMKKGMDAAAFASLQKGWNSMVSVSVSASKEGFLRNSSDLKADLTSNHYEWAKRESRNVAQKMLIAASAYIEANRVPVRHRFTAYAISDTMHFGHTTTSIAGGAHWPNIKMNLKLVHGSLRDVYDCNRACPSYATQSTERGSVC